MSRPPATGIMRYICGRFLVGSREKPDKVAEICGAFKTSAVMIANARRIVACWNACLGISTEVLELYGLEAARKSGPEYERQKRDRAVEETLGVIRAMEESTLRDPATR